MEESGHYYTVYFTSLATGFHKEVAYTHALLAQMPDEVGWLDAANMHINQCMSMNETDLRGRARAVPVAWRYLIEYIIHSLPDKTTGNRSSAFQRAKTHEMLLKRRADSLEFGLLLHRLGDTYAHSVMDHEQDLYTTTTSGTWQECLSLDSLGHARNIADTHHGMHDPDHPYKRPTLFYRYLDDLYDVLLKKASEKASAPLCGKPRLDKGEVKLIFGQLLEDKKDLVQVSLKAGIERYTPFFFMRRIREMCKSRMHISMEPYQPELVEKQSLPEFLRDHPELATMGVNENNIIKAVVNLGKEL